MYSVILWLSEYFKAERETDMSIREWLNWEMRHMSRERKLAFRDSLRAIAQEIENNV